MKLQKNQMVSLSKLASRTVNNHSFKELWRPLDNGRAVYTIRDVKDGVALLDEGIIGYCKCCGREIGIKITNLNIV